MRVWITGDTHGNFNEIRDFAAKLEDRDLQPTKETDIMVILGDVGVNVGSPENIQGTLKFLSKLPFTFFCIRGNHEDRPKEKYGYKLASRFDSDAMIHPNFPSVVFPIDGKTYNLAGRSCFVMGGAYSVDKMLRLENGWSWFEDEMLNENELQDVVDYAKEKKNFDVIFTHTCPYNYLPREAFIEMPLKTENYSMEKAFDEIEQSITYNEWYCGHFHTDKLVDKIRFMYADVVLL